MAIENEKKDWSEKLIYWIGYPSLAALLIIMGAEAFSQRETRTENIYGFRYKGNPSSLVKETKYITNFFSPIIGEQLKYYAVINGRDTIKVGTIVSDRRDVIRLPDFDRRKRINPPYINGEQIEQ